MKHYLIEGIGTFFLLMAVALPQASLAPLAAGAALTVLIIAGGAAGERVHYNPAQTLGQLMRGHTDSQAFPVYLLAQLAGSVLAALICAWLAPVSDTVAVAMKDPIKGVVAEFLGTFLLVFASFQATLYRKELRVFLYAIAAGLSWILGRLIFGDISGGLFNPALAVGLSVNGQIPWPDLWVFLIGDLLGAAAAVTVLTLFNPEKQVL